MWMCWVVKGLMLSRIIVDLALGDNLLFLCCYLPTLAVDRLNDNIWCLLSLMFDEIRLTWRRRRK